MKIYHLSFLLLSINGMAQENKDVSSLENEVWNIGSGSTAAYRGKAYGFLKNGDFVLTSYYSGSGYYQDELKGKYIYFPKKEEVYLTYKKDDKKNRITGRVSEKECIKLMILPDSTRQEVWFYVDWEKRGQQYFPLGMPKVYAFSAKVPVDNGYTLHVAGVEKLSDATPQLMPGTHLFSRIKTPTSKSVEK